VPDPVANEMAADLTADLDEAESEGRSAEAVLGNSAFDPRRFAAAWAIARGVTNVPSAVVPSPRRSPALVVVAACIGALSLLAGLALLLGRVHGSVAVAAVRFGSRPVPFKIFGPPAPGISIFKSGTFGPGSGGAVVALLAVVLLLFGAAGLVVAVVLSRSTWWGQHPLRRRGGPPTPNFN
jgi:hypothetical protein